MSERKEANGGSTVLEKDTKTEQEKTLTEIRRIHGVNCWFEATPDLKGARQHFHTGRLSDVTFNGRARQMKDVLCSTTNISEATATGILEIDTMEMPEDTLTSRRVGYCTTRKVFHNYYDPEEVFDACDYLLLLVNGSSTACWKTAEIPAPAGS